MSISDTSIEQRGARVRFPPPLVFLGVLLLGVALQHTVAAARFALPRLLTVGLGAVLILGGLGIGASAIRLFVRSGQNPAPWTPTPSLVLAGPYRFTRNPMYTGMALVLLGIGFAANDVWIALMVLPALAIVHGIAVLPEERYLADKFGKPYDDYRAQVRRYL